MTEGPMKVEQLTVHWDRNGAVSIDATVAHGPGGTRYLHKKQVAVVACTSEVHVAAVRGHTVLAECAEQMRKHMLAILADSVSTEPRPPPEQPQIF